MAIYLKPQNQPDWKLLIHDVKSKSVGNSINSDAYNLSLKSAILILLIISSFIPANLQAAGSFGTISGLRGEKSQSGFSSMEDAAAWGWANSLLATMPNIYSEGGVVYYKHGADGAPPASGWTNYWWGYYYHPTPGLIYGPFNYYPIDYYPNVIPLAKNFGSTQNLCVGNPIHLGIGEKYQIEKDYTGKDDLDFTRYYHSSVFAPRGGLGFSWRHAYDRKISVLNSATFTFAYITRASGKQFSYQLAAGLWRAEGDINDILIHLTDADGNITGWQLTDGETDEIETYNVSGKLVSIADRTGLTQTLTYSDASTPAAVAPTAGLLLRVTDAFGHQLNFTYDASSRIDTMTDPAGGVYGYDYDSNNNLVSVTYPDGSSKTYHYENAAFPHALTGITDENGNRFASFSYDTQGRAISSEHAGGAERVSLLYNADGSTMVTDALGTARTYQFQTILGVVKPKGQSQPGGSGCGASASALSYDANGNVSSRTDFNGNRTDYSYDLARNLETRRTEGLTAAGATTSATRTITTAWHPTFRLPVQITNGNQQTRYVYNSQGDTIEKTIQDLTTNSTRSWHTSYSYGAVPGVLLQKVEDGPRTDVSDLTTYDYYPTDATCHGGHLGCRGQLQQITDALGHRTRLTRYSAAGQIEELIDANGLVTTLTYDLRQRLTSVDSGGERTTYAYDPVGQLTRITRADGSYLAYSYDAAHRLVNTQDDQGNSLTYTLDAIGNRIKEEAHDPNGQLARSQSRVYDALSRLQHLVLPQ
jgi:YD repeat-containing protein